MVSGLVHWATVVAVIAVATLSPSGMALADPSQDQKFFELLNQQDVPPVDNDNSLIDVAKKTCSRLDEGMSAGDLVELFRNNGFNENPLPRLQNQARITRTIDRFINAAVQAYCPNNRGKIASITGYRSAQPRIELASLAFHTGDIAPTKPLPVPAQPAPQVPQEIQPVPQVPPPPPRHAPPVPKQAPPPQEPPPPAEAPQEAPPEATPAPAAPGSGGNAPAPAAPGGGGNAPAPDAPGGGAGGGNTPAPPTPEAPAPPGHIRLAP